jgi:hypothetical protein
MKNTTHVIVNRTEAVFITFFTVVATNIWLKKYKRHNVSISVKMFTTAAVFLPWELKVLLMRSTKKPIDSNKRITRNALS